MKKLIITSLALVITLTLATLLQGNAASARSDAYNQGYWDAMEEILMTFAASTILIPIVSITN